MQTILQEDPRQGALDYVMIRIRFGGTLYSNYNKERTHTLLRPLHMAKVFSILELFDKLLLKPKASSHSPEYTLNMGLPE